VVTQTETVYRYPPADWMADCLRPELAGGHNRDLWTAFQARGTAIDECNARMRVMREWAKEGGHVF
jgi:hypothetical protein